MSAVVMPNRTTAKYWRKVRAKAKELKSDGCSGVPDFYKDCCLEHDVHYRTHKTIDGIDIDRKTADGTLKKCIQSRSLFGRWSPMAQWRYLAIRRWGKKAWDH